MPVEDGFSITGRGTTVTGIEMFRKLLDEAEAGDNVNTLPLGPGKGGIRFSPFVNNYRPQFYFRTTDVTGATMPSEGTEPVMPGDDVTMFVSLITPITLDSGLQFALREGGRTKSNE